MILRIVILGNVFPMIKDSLRSNPFLAQVVWLIYALLFYQSGLTATVWLLEPEQFNGGIDWLWLIVSPIVLPMFFIINRHLGCAGGDCRRGVQENDFRAPPGY